MIIFDIETTSLDRNRAGMLSLGAVHVESGREFYQECVPSLEKKDIIFDKLAFEINGFNIEQVKKNMAKRYDDDSLPIDIRTYCDFRDWALDICKDKLLGGYNIGSFDCMVLHKIYDDTFDMTWPFGHRFVDIHSLGYLIVGESLSSENLAIRLGIEPEPKPHHALLGAKKEMECYLALQKKI